MKNKIIISLASIGMLLATGAVATISIEGSAIGTSGSDGVKTRTQVEIVAEPVNKTGEVEKGDDSSEGSSRVLPTVNKVDDDSKDDSNEQESRVLPTANKKTGAKVEVKGWDSVKKQEIETRVQAVLDENPKITSANVSEDAVEVKYSAPAKLFGFLPISMNINVSADANQRVKVQFPWYRWLVSTPFANIAQATDLVFQNNQTNLEFLRKQDTSKSQAETLVTISTVLKASYDLALQKKP